MPLSNRLDVLQKLTSFLKQITVANGYQHDLATSVFRGRALFGSDDPIPMISILESPRSDIGIFAGSNERKEQWSLLIQGWTHDDVDNPTDPAYELMADVERHLEKITECSTANGQPLHPDDYLLGRSIADMRVHPGVVRPPLEGVSSKAFFYLPVSLTLVK